MNWIRCPAKDYFWHINNYDKTSNNYVICMWWRITIAIVDFSHDYPGFLASIGELHVLKLSLELKFGLSSEFSNVSSNYLLESFLNDASALSCV